MRGLEVVRVSVVWQAEAVTFGRTFRRGQEARADSERA